MPPGQPIEQLHLHQEQNLQDPIQAVLHEEHNGLAAHPSHQPNPLKHDRPEDPQSDGTSKRTKLFNSSETQTREPVILSREEYTELISDINLLRDIVTENHREMEARCEEYSDIKAKREITERALSDETKHWSDLIRNLNDKIERLERTCAGIGKQLQDNTAQREDLRATKLQLAKLKDEVGFQSKSAKEKDAEITSKDLAMKDKEAELEVLERDSKAVKKQLKESKQMICDLKCDLAEAEKTLKTRDGEIKDAKHANTAHETKLAKKQKGLWKGCSGIEQQT